MTDVTDEMVLAAAVKAMCKEATAQMGEPEPEGCNGLCEGCDHERSLATAAIAAITPMIREECAKSLEDAAEGQEALGEAHAANVLRYKAAAIRSMAAREGNAPA